VVRVDDEGRGVLRPGIADGLKRGSPAERFEVFDEVVGGDEGLEVGFQAVEGVVVEGLHGGVLDGAKRPHLAAVSSLRGNRDIPCRARQR
jgi:hypothetical protein